MKISAIIAIVVQYDTLLTRYARLFIKNQSLAEGIVMYVMEQYYDEQKELPPGALRKHLQQKVKLMCAPWTPQNAGLMNQNNTYPLN